MERDVEQASGELFAEVQRVRSFDDVVRQIRDAVLSGQIPSGQRLPSERELALRLRVSRPTLREGLRALEAEGLIQIRLGGSGGIYASAPDGQLVGSALESLMRIRQASRWELQEFRRTFEPENAALAAKRATDTDLHNLHNAAHQLTHTIQTHASETTIAAADFAYHEALATASHNEVRVAIMMGISQATKRTLETLAATNDNHALLNAADQLHHLTTAIQHANPHAAHTHMLNHLNLL